MTKFLIILMTLYFLYYAGNIVYDLFIKKELALSNEESEVFSLAEFEEQNRDEVITVAIEDVENLNTPSSFNIREFPAMSKVTEEGEELEVWRQKFEAELNIDAFDINAAATEFTHSVMKEAQSAGKVPKAISDPVDTEYMNIQLHKINRDKWCQLWNDAETTIQMISNVNGHKVYRATAI